MKKLLVSFIFIITGIALFAQSPNKQVIFSDKAPKAIGPYSQAYHGWKYSVSFRPDRYQPRNRED